MLLEAETKKSFKKKRNSECRLKDLEDKCVFNLKNHKSPF